MKKIGIWKAIAVKKLCLFKMFTQAREKVEENRNEKSSLSISRCCGVWLDPQTRQERGYLSKKYMKEVDHLRKVIIKKQLHD